MIVISGSLSVSEQLKVWSRLCVAAGSVSKEKYLFFICIFDFVMGQSSNCLPEIFRSGACTTGQGSRSTATLSVLLS